MGQGMKGEVEDPTGYLFPTFSPSILELGESGESICYYEVFVAGWFVIVPTEPQVVIIWIKQVMD